MPFGRVVRSRLLGRISTIAIGCVVIAGLLAIAATVRAQTAAPPAVVAQPARLAFAATAGTVSAPAPVTVTNTGAGAARITQLELRGPEAASFVLAQTGSCLPATVLEPAASCRIDVRF